MRMTMMMTTTTMTTTTTMMMVMVVMAILMVMVFLRPAQGNAHLGKVQFELSLFGAGSGS